MKSIDASILIGANGNSAGYWSGLFDKAASEIGFLSVHAYPLYGWTGYRDYVDGDPDACDPIRVAKQALDSHPGVSGRPIKLMMTEFAAGAFNRWDGSGSDIARAVITFDLQGQLLQCRDCYFSQFWNTINVYESDNSVFNALRRDNTLTAVGQALSIWGRYLEDEMIMAKGTRLVKCFATKTDGKALAVFAVNKDTVEHRIEVSVRNLPKPRMNGEKWVFSGRSPEDQNPYLVKEEDMSLFKDVFSAKLDPVSVTMFRFQLQEE
jgi:hypothetical protein